MKKGWKKEKEKRDAQLAQEADILCKVLIEALSEAGVLYQEVKQITSLPEPLATEKARECLRRYEALEEVSALLREETIRQQEAKP